MPHAVAADTTLLIKIYYLDVYTYNYLFFGHEGSRLADILYAIDNNKQTLPVGTRIVYDKTIDPMLTQAKSVQEFKPIAGQWYMLKYIFGKEYRDKYCIYEIAGVLQLQYKLIPLNSLTMIVAQGIMSINHFS